jgi:hypothetical protein
MYMFKRSKKKQKITNTKKNGFVNYLRNHLNISQQFMLNIIYRELAYAQYKPIVADFWKIQCIIIQQLYAVA